MGPRSNSSGPLEVSFIVPTFRRPEFLRLCLAAIATQTASVGEVLVGIRADDHSNEAVLGEASQFLPVRTVVAKGRGVVGSMSSCLAEATGHYIALVDDDVELPANWLETMLSHMAANTDVLGAAGRDLLKGNEEARAKERITADVGRFHWYGKVSGNHHLGAGLPRKVDILRGSNCLFRGEFLRAVGFEQRLRGQGAQVHWELALALHARRRDGRLFYDPLTEVIHHVAPRHDADQLHRGTFNAGALSDMFYNEAFILHSYAPWRMQVAALAWAFVVGGGFTPGLLKCFHLLWRREPHLASRIAAFSSGWLAGLRDARRFP